MSLQDDVFDVNKALLHRENLKKLYQKPSLDESIYKAFQNIIEQLWQYETQLEDAEKIIASQNLLLKTKLNESA